MSLIEQLKTEEDKRNKIFYDIVMASEMLQHNIKLSREATTDIDKEKFLEHVLTDAVYIQKMALLGQTAKLTEK